MKKGVMKLKKRRTEQDQTTEGTPERKTHIKGRPFFFLFSFFV